MFNFNPSKTSFLIHSDSTLKSLVPSVDGVGWKASAKLEADFLVDGFHKNSKSESAFWFCYLFIFSLVPLSLVENVSAVLNNSNNNNNNTPGLREKTGAFEICPFMLQL